MIYQLFIRLSLFSFVLLLFLTLSTDVRSQGSSSPISWHNIVYDARIAALGQSTASLMNRSAYQLNPAIPFEEGVLTASTYLFSTTPFTSEFVSDGPSLYSPAIGYSAGKFSYMAMFDHTTFSYPDVPGFNGGKFTSSMLRLQLGYQISENFYTGAGFVYSSINSPTTLSVGGEIDGNASAWGFSFGAYYLNQFETDRFKFKPQAGLSLNDLSTGFEFEGSDVREQMPGQIRFGLGIDISSQRERFNLPLFGVGIYTGFSKYLSRWEYNPESNEIDSPSGFEALFTTWNSISRFDGVNTEEITLAEQISTSLGIEFNLLETLYLRYGILGGADYWVRPQQGLGFEIDMYYVALAITNISYQSSERWLPMDDTTVIQATFRIPLDGKPRNSLIRHIIKR